MVRGYRESALVGIVGTLLGVMVFMAVFGLVWLRAEVTSTEYAIGNLESRMAEAMKEKQELEARLSAVMSIQEVGQRGMQLGFPDRQKVYIVMREDTAPAVTASLKEGSRGRLAER